MKTLIFFENVHTLDWEVNMPNKPGSGLSTRTIKADQEFWELVTKASHATGMDSSSAYVRHAVIKQLRADGFTYDGDVKKPRGRPKREE